MLTNADTLHPEIAKAIGNLVDYLRTEEERDFIRNEDEVSLSSHILGDILQVSAWLNAPYRRVEEVTLDDLYTVWDPDGWSHNQSAHLNDLIILPEGDEE